MIFKRKGKGEKNKSSFRYFFIQVRENSADKQADFFAGAGEIIAGGGRMNKAKSPGH
jgi:hypothetical protein